MAVSNTLASQEYSTLQFSKPLGMLRHVNIHTKIFPEPNAI
jgi:hypothetical protein